MMWGKRAVVGSSSFCWVVIDEFFPTDFGGMAHG